MEILNCELKEHRDPKCVVFCTYTSYTHLTSIALTLFVYVLTISATSITFRPFSTNSLRILLVLLVMFRDISSEWIIWIGRAEKCLYRQKDSTDLEGRRPFVFGN